MPFLDQDCPWGPPVTAFGPTEPPGADSAMCSLHKGTCSSQSPASGQWVKESKKDSTLGMAQAKQGTSYNLRFCKVKKLPRWCVGN